LFGSEKYFTNSFKTCIMNNFGLGEPCSLNEKWTLLKDEIAEKALDQLEKEFYLQNLERAYFKVKRELVGWEEERDGSRGAIYSRA